MVLCFPNLAAFVACCPHPGVMSPQEAGCPAQYLRYREDCCTKDMVGAIFRQLGTLSEPEVAATLPEDDYPEVIRRLTFILHRYVRDTDVLDIQAWCLLVLASARDAIVHVDRVKDSFVRQTSMLGMQALLMEARQVSRQVGRALFRIENFHQFLIGAQAMGHGLLIHGFDPELVRSDFTPALWAYLELVVAHNLLAYDLIPLVEQITQDDNIAAVEAAEFDNPIINLLVVSLGTWVKTGFITIRSILKHRSTRLRIFVLGDAPGLRAWQEAVDELATNPVDVHLLRGVAFEYVDFAAHPRFKAFLRRYPRGCTFGDAGQAILARVVCHELLPPDVERVVALDLGDILVLDDIRHLWDLGDSLAEHQLMAAGHAVALHHINAGLVLYDARRMRERNFTSVVLRVARDGLRKDVDRICPRDQLIINVLHSHRAEYGYAGPSPVMVLPCRWAVFPVAEWQPHWNSPEMWVHEVVERKRYPGVVSAGRVEVFCPDEIDLLSAWAFIPISEGARSRQSRLWEFAGHEGRKSRRYCSARPVGERCCQCGEPASLVHVAGDMKRWPAMQNLLRAYLPAWKAPPPADSLVQSASRPWWGGGLREQRILNGTEREAFLVAKDRGLNTVFDRCVTLTTAPSHGKAAMSYHPIKLKQLVLPLRLEVETTAPQDAHLLLGIGGHSGLELVMGSSGGQSSSLRWTRSSPGWAVRGDLMSVPKAAQQERTAGGDPWAKFLVRVDVDGRFVVQHGEVSWGSFVPDFIFGILQSAPLTVSVGTLGSEAKWAVCLAGQGAPESPSL